MDELSNRRGKSRLTELAVLFALNRPYKRVLIYCADQKATLTRLQSRFPDVVFSLEGEYGLVLSEENWRA